MKRRSKDTDNVTSEKHSSKEIRAENIMRRLAVKQRYINYFFIGFAVSVLVLDLVRVLVTNLDD